MQEELQLKNYIICYFDVLGTKEKDVQKAIRDMLIVSHCANKTYQLKNKLERRSFSDNFLIASENNNEFALEDVLHTIGYVYSLSLIDSNIFIRGSLVEGELSFLPDIVLGKGLLEGYYLENEAAVFPRIVVSNELKVYASKSYNDYFIIDEDGVVFLNCFKYISLEFLKIRSNTLINDLEKQRALFLKRKGIKQASKIGWVINYIKNYLV